MTTSPHTGPATCAQPLALTKTRAPKTKHSQPVTYEVVHWIRGRIRLRIPRLAYDAKFAQRLGPGTHDLARTQRGTRECRFVLAGRHLSPGSRRRQWEWQTPILRPGDPAADSRMHPHGSGRRGCANGVPPGCIRLPLAAMAPPCQAMQLSTILTGSACQPWGSPSARAHWPVWQFLAWWWAA